MLERHDTGSTTASWLRGAGVLVLALTATMRPVEAVERPEAAEQTLLLEVQVNGRPIGKIGEFVLRDGTLLVRRAELRDLGLHGPPAFLRRNPDAASSSPDDLIGLSDLPGLNWRLDRQTQTLYISAEIGALLTTAVPLDSQERPVGRRIIESGTGMTLNYDIAGTSAGGQNGATGSLDFRAFSPWGVVSSGWLAYAGATAGGAGRDTAIRLDSTYSFADVNTMRRYSLGDFITGGLSWTRPVRLEGVQVLRDFSTRPDLVTFPMPTVNGSVAVPSTLNVLADGSLVVSSQIDAGPFEIPQIPVISGAGTITMTVTNALGQTQNVTQPFYASSTLLAAGLQTYSVQAGLVRRNWGSVSNEYGKFAASAVYRRGITTKATVEGSVEATPGTVAVGAGSVLQVGNLGTLDFAAAASAGSVHPGGQLSAGAQHIGRVFSLGVSAIVASRNYRDVAAMNGEPVPRKQLNGTTGVSMRRLGSIAAAYGGIDQDAAPGTIRLNYLPALHSHIVSASYSLQFRHLSFFVTEFRDLVDRADGGLQAGLIIPFGRRSSIDVSGTSDGEGQIQVQESAAMIGD